ncbi:MAG: hypothetical protein H7Y11_01675 [Armatimonadetes bacterium]|nr:hypothetical protein [Anaerolineae bacterium]
MTTPPIPLPPTRRNRSPEATTIAIYDAVRAAPVPLTRLEIARAIQRRKTPHLIVLIESLVQQGWLHRTQSAYHNGVVVYLYSAVEAL